MSDALLQVLDARYTYAERYPALDGVSVQIAAGERVALMGANGCGKSTLLRVLAGLIFLDAGSYTAFDAEITEQSMLDEGVARGFRSRLGVIFQNSDAQVFSATVTEEIAFGPLQLGLSPAEAQGRVDDVCALLDIQGLRDRAPFQLSGGQKKKVAIASVLAMNPDVILLDEPTAALDPRSATAVNGILERLHAAGKTLVTATHDLETVTQIADRAIVFGEDHRILIDAPVAEVLADRELLIRANLIAG